MQKKVINILLLAFRITTNAKEWCEGEFTAPGHGGLKIKRIINLHCASVATIESIKILLN